jgi:hypothetical protein
MDASAGVRLEKETEFTDSGTRMTTDRSNVSSFVELRGSLFDRLLDPRVVRALHEIDQGCSAAEQRGAADLCRRIGVFGLGLAREANWGKAVNMRIDTTWNHHLTGRIDGACRGSQGA